METRLKENEYLADDFSIADIANWCWVRTYKWSGVNIDGLEGVKRWMQMMEDRPACKKGVQIPKRESSKKVIKNAKSMLQS